MYVKQSSNRMWFLSYFTGTYKTFKFFFKFVLWLKNILVKAKGKAYFTIFANSNCCIYRNYADFDKNLFSLLENSYFCKKYFCKFDFCQKKGFFS